jgi:Fur family ferric uptake transcriptional regulator
VSTAPTWTEHAQAVLADAGHQRGGARERVIELLAGESCALTALEIEDVLRAQGTPIGRASIYRVLELLVEHGLVQRLTIDPGQARFEVVDPSGEHHHHLLCDSCGRLVAFDDPGLEQAIDRLADRLGMRIEHHDVLLRGSCRRCA